MAKREKSLAQVKHEIAQEIRAEQTKASLTPERIRLAYRRLFEGEDGEIVLEDLRARFHLGTTVRKRPNGIDPYETHFNEGCRFFYVSICEKKEPPLAPRSEPEPEEIV